MKIAALTSVRNSDHFLRRWIAYYGAQLGYENLYVIVDGMDQTIPSDVEPVNFRRIEHVPQSRVAGDKSRAARASALAAELFETYDAVIGTDVDEFLAVDPKLGISLQAFLTDVDVNTCLSAMGIDVARHDRLENALDWSKPFLQQRRFGLISDRYTKANILFKPLKWGSGFHRVKGHKFTIHPDLYLFHFGSVDTAEIQSRAQDAERVASGWSGHQTRRAAVSTKITSSKSVEGDAVFQKARRALSKPRSLWAWNKPRPLKPEYIIEIPTRFRTLF